jgi:transposase-like protein
MKSSTISEQRWRRLILEQRASGQSVAGFCRQAGISQASFYVWQRRLQSAPRRGPGPCRRARGPQPGAGAGFVEVKLPGPTAVEHGTIELRLPCGRCVIVRPGFDRSTLRELLATLESSASLGNGLDSLGAER